ncbi:MAG: inorganic pyrophosphatase [Verrucomicrobiota bacterium JB022]|nr:inorganic pyrophosphatase [Verrucomicrobiota bacterium JB022]
MADLHDYKFTPYRPHPWHGISRGPQPPATVHAYIEITPFDVIKYEIDRRTGYIRVDRPQASSSLPPALYGIVPQTLAGRRVAAMCPETDEADGDPIDICVVSEPRINRSEVLLTARIIGGLSTLDSGRADDKLVAVLEKDPVWGDVNELEDLPERLVDRLHHYFSTYKLDPTTDENPVRILGRYDRKRALEIVQASMADYDERFAEGRDAEGV